MTSSAGRRPLPRRLAALATTLLAAWALLGALATPARAHSLLQTAIPADGAALDAAPFEVRLTFNERISASIGALRIYDDTGEQVDAGDASTADGDPSTLRVRLRDGLGDGTYVATFAVTSADAHPVRGAIVYSVGEAAAADDAELAAIFARAQDGDRVLAATASSLRGVVYAGGLLAVGGTIFLLWVAGRDAADRARLRRIVRAGAVVCAATTVLALGVQGALLSGLGTRALADPAVVGRVLATSFGRSAGVRLAGLALLLATLPGVWSRARVIASGAGAAAVIASFALTGHTANAEPRWLVVGANLSHTLAAATWFGGLVLLVVALRGLRAGGDARDGGRLVARFSTLATAAVLLVTVAGTALAWSEVRALRALTSTTYGWTLVAKITVVAGVLALGAYNNRRLVPAIARGVGGAWPLLQRTLRYEVAGIVVVLALTGFLVNLVPARSEAGVTGPFSETIALSEEYDVMVTVDPNRAGRNELHLYLLGADGRPAEAARELTLGLSLPSNDIATIERTPEIAGPGHWLLSGPELSIPGQWNLEVRARVSDFDELTVDVPLRVNA